MSMDPKSHPDYPLAAEFVRMVGLLHGGLPSHMPMSLIISAGDDVLMMSHYPSRESVGQLLLGMLKSQILTAEKNEDLEMVAAMQTIEEYAKVVLGLSVEGGSPIPLGKPEAMN